MLQLLIESNFDIKITLIVVTMYRDLNYTCQGCKINSFVSLIHNRKEDKICPFLLEEEVSMSRIAFTILPTFCLRNFVGSCNG